MSEALFFGFLVGCLNYYKCRHLRHFFGARHLLNPISSSFDPPPPPSNPTSFPTWQKKNNTLFECQCIQHESTNSGHYINYVSYWSRERHFTLYPKLQESLAVYKAKPIFSFLSYFTKSLRIDRTRDHPLWSWMSIVLWNQGGGWMLPRHNISRTIFWAAGRSIR